MRSLTSVSASLSLTLPITITRSIAAASILFEVFFFLTQAPHMLVECAAISLLGSHCLEFRRLLEPQLDFLVSVTQCDRGVQTLHVRAQVINGSALLAFRVSVLLRRLGSSFLELQGSR
jgi:hypothetical protein